MLVLVRKDINSIIFLYSIKFQENIDIKKKKWCWFVSHPLLKTTKQTKQRALELSLFRRVSNSCLVNLKN